MTCIEPLPRKYSDRERARLQALRPLADEIAETVLAHMSANAASSRSGSLGRFTWGC